jgi:hypothetical protein
LLCGPEPRWSSAAGARAKACASQGVCRAQGRYVHRCGSRCAGLVKQESCRACLACKLVIACRSSGADIYGSPHHPLPPWMQLHMYSCSRCRPALIRLVLKYAPTATTTDPQPLPPRDAGERASPPSARHVVARNPNWWWAHVVHGRSGGQPRQYNVL